MPPIDSRPMKTTRSRALFRRAKKILPGGVNSPVRAFRSVGGTPRFLVKGRGPYAWDADGNPLVKAGFECCWGTSQGQSVFL